MPPLADGVRDGGNITSRVPFAIEWNFWAADPRACTLFFFDDINYLFFFAGRFNIDTSIYCVVLFLVVFGEN